MKFIEEIKRPFNIVTLSLAIASIVLSIFLFFKSQKTKSLSYHIDETASLIYNSNNSSSKIKLFERDSILITKNVYLITGTFWNSGDIPIYKSDIRKEIEFNINEKNRILDYKITKQKDSSVADFSLLKKNRNTLEVDWKHFDPNYGFNFQIIYIGNGNTEFNIKGKLLDIPSIQNISLEQKSISIISIILVSVILVLISNLLSFFQSKNKNISNLWKPT